MHDSKRLQFIVQIHDFGTLARFRNHEKVPGHGHDFGMTLLDDVLDLSFVEQQTGFNFEDGTFQKDGFFVNMIKSLDDLDLFFNLSYNVLHPFFGSFYHDDDTGIIFDFWLGYIQTQYVDVAFQENSWNSVQ